MAKFKRLEIYDDLLSPDYDYKVALDGRGTGKTHNFLGTLVEIARLVTLRVLCTREYQNSIADSSKAEIEMFIHDNGYTDEFKITEHRIYHKGTGSIFIFRGLARNPTGLKSIPKIDIALIEECEDITENSLVNVLMPTIRQDGSELWIIGNNKHKTNAVAQMFVENEPPPRTRVFKHTYHDNPHTSAKFIREAEHIKKTRPALYRHLYLGEYLDTSELKMVRHITIQDDYPTYKDDDMVVIGVDIARKGGDPTTIYVRRGRSIMVYESHDEMDIDILGPILGNMMLSYRPDFVNVDSTGHGSWLPDALKAYGIPVHAINFASVASDPEKYANKRTELYGLAEDYFIDGGGIPNNPTLIQELESSFYIPNKKNIAQMISKDDIRKIINRSTDHADGFCLTLETHGKDMFKRENTVESAVKRKKLTQSVLNSGKFRR